MVDTQAEQVKIVIYRSEIVDIEVQHVAICFTIRRLLIRVRARARARRNQPHCNESPALNSTIEFR